MKRYVGTSAFGLRAPIVKEGDDLSQVVIDTVDNAIKYDKIELRDRDVIAITESLLARAQGNYAQIDAITKDLNSKFDEEIGVVFPILSRNRFATVLKAIANTNKKISVFLSFPSDEVGNSLFDKELLLGKDISTNVDILNEEEYRNLVGDKCVHIFTGVDYVKLYKDLAVNDNIEIYLTNNPEKIVERCKEVLIANIHDREYLRDTFQRLGAKNVYTIGDILNKSVDGSGFNEKYGLYGSNLATETSVKLFPRNSQDFVENLQTKLKDKYNKDIEVMIYGDGAFKDPVGKIWELADPIVSPGYTKGLEGTPNEIKIKYIADTELSHLKGEEASEAIRNKISEKDSNLVGNQASEGTTPRQITDLLGSLADLTSGSGDKGTPIVLIQGYFDNYATE